MGTRALATVVSSVAVVVSSMVLASSGAAHAQDADSTGSAEQQLAERYTPVLKLKSQDAPCDTDGEPFAPMSVDVILDSESVLLRQVGLGDPVVQRAPGASDLAGLGAGFFLDFAGSSLEPGCVYEQTFEQATTGRPAMVYAHIVTPEPEPGEPAMVFLQYWFYWYYNDWNNKHESDWEGIAVVFEAASAAEALDTEPVAVGYSQHEGGERADWTSDKLERVDGRPVVYPSAGSHASYFGSSVYLGRGANEGFGCDTTTGPWDTVDPEVTLLPDRVDDPDDPLAWLSYDGRWGERHGGAFNGPTGPTSKDRWLDPQPWFDELRDDSVVIPAGDSRASGVISSFCSVVGWGSSIVVTASSAPQRLLIPLLLIVAAIVVVVRRTRWDADATSPVVARRSVGQYLSTAVEIYRRDPLVFVMFGVVALPAALFGSLVGGVVTRLPLVGPLIRLAGEGVASNLWFAAVAGSVANVAGVVAVGALVARHLIGDDPDDATVGTVVADVWRRWPALVSVFVRAWVVVGALAVTVVGLPWAVRQSVRYQFAPQVVATEHLDGRRALARSSRLVTGRWWRTAIVAVVVNAVTGALALGTGLLALVAFSDLPLWFFSGLVSFLYVAAAPFGAIALTLLCGDALARESDATTATATATAPTPTPTPTGSDV